eukprot:TRINITY_DN1419_c0_g1_i1.p1 TRINITY_DN1419_c0_g1~~TRINITY_DN1419_c0_g1_i1.p1  ORF type:complete len:438 (+),score=98.09 TRINITY_DN1419_c0_g1_i1:152-1465(+)
MAPLWRYVVCVSLVAVCLASSVTGFSEERPSDQRVLVLLDDLEVKSTHSIFFKSLADGGYNLDYRQSDDRSVVLEKYGKYEYDAAIIFASASESFGDGLDVNSVLQFIDAGHDVILAADEIMGDFMRDLVTECGADFDDEELDAVVIDHMAHVEHEIDSKDTLVLAKAAISSRAIFGEAPYTAPIVFRGRGLKLNAASSLILPVLTASETAFSAMPSMVVKAPPRLRGTAVTLVAAMQARNNARVLISGSLELFSNKFFTLEAVQDGQVVRTANQQFAVEAAKWVFHERGHLKAGVLHHHRKGTQYEPSFYRIGDLVNFSVDIFEWSEHKWVPYVADDVQVQFFMMSPYVLQNLSHNGDYTYYTELHLPDVYGVFQFKVEYQRLGYTTLALSTQIPVRPFRHDEYERFIGSAFPYYASTFSMMAGFFLFGFVFLYHK